MQASAEELTPGDSISCAGARQPYDESPLNAARTIEVQQEDQYVIIAKSNGSRLSLIAASGMAVKSSISRFAKSARAKCWRRTRAP